MLPRGTIIRRSVRPRPTPPGSPVYIQSTSGSSWSDATAAGISSRAGGAAPASSSATRTAGSSESRAAITAPADPPPTTTKSNDEVSADGAGLLTDGTPPGGLARHTGTTTEVDHGVR